MTKTIEGVTVEAGMGRRRYKRGEKKAEIKRIQEKEKSLIEGVPDFATKQLIRNVNYGAEQQYRTGIQDRTLAANGHKDNQPRKRQYAYPAFQSPKTKSRLFLKAELSDRPDNNGRFAVMAGFTRNEPPSTFISAFTNKLAAETASLLVYKEGSYPYNKVVDRGPNFHFETVHYQRRKV